MGIGSRSATCASCGKRLGRKQWYYRNGKHFCKKSCWETERAKAADQPAAAAAQAAEPPKPADAPAGKAQPAEAPAAGTPPEKAPEEAPGKAGEPTRTAAEAGGEADTGQPSPPPS